MANNKHQTWFTYIHMIIPLPSAAFVTPGAPWIPNRTVLRWPCQCDACHAGVWCAPSRGAPAQREFLLPGWWANHLFVNIIYNVIWCYNITNMIKPLQWFTHGRNHHTVDWPFFCGYHVCRRLAMFLEPQIWFPPKVHSISHQTIYDNIIYVIWTMLIHSCEWAYQQQ